VIGFREMQIELFQRGDDRRSDHHAGEPFVVGRDDVPRRRRGRGVRDRILIGRLVAIPQLPFLDIGHREFPVLRRVFQPAEEALTLLLLGDVEEELQHHGAVARQIALE